MFVKEVASSTFFPTRWVLYPTDPLYSRWNTYKFAYKQETDINRVFFVQVDFFDQLLFRAVYDFTDQKYKSSIYLPPGNHGVCFIEIVLVLDDTGKNKIEFRRLEWKNETIMPNNKDYSPEARVDEDTPGNTITAGGAFFTSMYMITQILTRS